MKVSSLCYNCNQPNSLESVHCRNCGKKLPYQTLYPQAQNKTEISRNIPIETPKESTLYPCLGNLFVVQPNRKQGLFISGDNCFDPTIRHPESSFHIHDQDGPIELFEIDKWLFYRSNRKLAVVSAPRLMSLAAVEHNDNKIQQLFSGTYHRSSQQTLHTNHIRPPDSGNILRYSARYQSIARIGDQYIAIVYKDKQTHFCCFDIHTNHEDPFNPYLDDRTAPPIFSDTRADWVFDIGATTDTSHAVLAFSPSTSNALFFVMENGMIKAYPIGAKAPSIRPNGLAYNHQDDLIYIAYSQSIFAINAKNGNAWEMKTSIVGDLSGIFPCYQDGNLGGSLAVQERYFFEARNNFTFLPATTQGQIRMNLGFFPSGYLYISASQIGNQQPLSFQSPYSNLKITDNLSQIPSQFAVEGPRIWCVYHDPKAGMGLQVIQR